MSDLVWAPWSFLARITPGAWPDWVAAVFTSLAFLVAATSYRRSVLIRRETQARLLYTQVAALKFHPAGTLVDMSDPKYPSAIGVLAGGTQIVPGAPGTPAKLLAVAEVIALTIKVHNGSSELLGPAKVQAVNTGRRQVYQDFSVIVDSIEPGTDVFVNFTWPNADSPGQPGLGATVVFRDSTRRWWRRYLSEPIEAVHADPENSLPTPAERAQYAANARAFGIEPAGEQKIPLRVWAHRRVRRLRGKSPIP